MNCRGCALIVLLSLTRIYAQSSNASDGVVTGSVVDSHRVGIAAATVYLQSTGKKDVSTATTDARGLYRFDVASGTYTVRAESNGKGNASAGPFAVERNKVTSIDLVLQPSTVTQPQFFDEPQFTVAGVTDNTYRGGHGSDAVLRSSEALTNAASALHDAPSKENADDPHHALAVERERSGRPLEAVQEFQRAAELHPSEPNFFDWGTELLAHHAPLPAAEVFTKGTRLFPQSVRMLLGLATSWYAAGSYEQAAQCFFEASDLNPNDPNPYLFLGKVQSGAITQSAGYDERMARFARLQPDNALANYYYAVSIWNRRSGAEDLEVSRKARDLLERAIALDPHLGLAYLQLGIVYDGERKHPDAIRAYRMAIDANPELEEAHYRLAKAYRVAGDRINAERELAIYKDLAKQSAEKVERERREVQQFVVALRSQNAVPATKQR